MLRDERLKQILAALGSDGSRTTSALASLFDVSDMTLRRDLDHLAAEGLIRRVRGGAVAVGGSDPGIGWRAQQNTAAKQRIGRVAAQLVLPESSIYLDAGTTAIEVGRALAERARRERFKARVVTPAVNIGAELAGVDGITVHQLGGEIDSSTMAATGQQLVAEIERMNFDVFFMGITGVDPVRGFTNSSPVGIEAKRTALSRSRETWAIADARKWRHVSAYEVAAFADVSGLVVDLEPDGDLRPEIEQSRLPIREA